ncbi:MAG: right-handed parallel beta-helix repeat-containing protein [Candidatus Heimdallarchaeum aukensis]|uniref:Right-handed parallel beta-helix repeat-containing protein n=1 Tax=Candidatus Heimdallarchaeum aukensis TaxID=2876573 RepID=A0A9Y1BMC5_9ARCH|nr:MAG: right-handed parallel beta-helix repeat-containing protein [Candidatus Heimdallarchaeum aukensis]
MKFTNRLQVLINSVIILSLITVGMVTSSAIQINSEENSSVRETITEDTVWEGITIYINESMLFNAKLTISNSIVIFKANATNEVILEIGDTLNITDSQILADDPDYNGKIKSLLGEEIIISNSEIKNIDISVNSAEVTIIDSVFDNCYEVKFLTLPETSIIARNTFKNNETGLSLTYSPIELINNTFENLDIGVSVSSSEGILIKGNSFTNIAETAIYQTKQGATIENNEFTDVNRGITIQQSKAVLIKENTFEKSYTAIMTLDSSYVTISTNSFANNEFSIDMSETYYSEVSDNTIENTTEIAMQILESDYVDILNNEITNSSIGIKLNENRASAIQYNTITDALLSIDIEHSRSIDVIANTIINSETAMYIEDSDKATLTANDILTSNIGISIWSSTSPALSSNKILDTNIGTELILVSEGLLLGNEFTNSQMGIYVVDTSETKVVDGTLVNVADGIKIVESPNFEVSGNTFEDISGDAVIFDDSNDSVVYHNNFYNITGKYGSIIDCIVNFEYEVSNGTIHGNYYEGVDETSVYIDTVTYEGKEIEIYDNHPLTEKYTVPPAISVVERDVQDPDDTMIVNVTAQIYKPSELSISAYLDYMSNFDDDWTSVEMTIVSSVGQIYIYQSSIPKLDYGLEITYRIRVVYESESTISSNYTYVVEYSDETPIIINNPTVVVRAEGSDKFTYTSVYYDLYYIVVQVRVKNQTANLAKIDGRDYVNISWTLITNEGNETHDNIMFYNTTTGVFELELGKFTANSNITYRIYAEDELGNSRWTLETYEIHITSETTEETGFDSVTLIGITASLFIIQTIVVIQRRKRQEN